MVGVSGGVDSLLLLEWLREQTALPLLAVHVHHGLSPHADAWAARVAEHCAAVQVPCTVLRVQVDRTQPSLEAAARAARHAAFASLLQPGDALLLAQHADDQAETLLLRLLRGSGLSGLGAMREARRLPAPDDVWLWRPLLALRRAELVAEAQRRGLRWCEDESNADTAHDRNFLRHEVLPRLAARWPALADTLARAARHLAAGDDLLNAYLDADLAPLLQPAGDDWGCGGRETLDAAALLALAGPLAPARQQALLRRWLARLGVPAFSEAWLEQLLGLAAARDDAEGELRAAGWEVHRYRGRLVAFPELPVADGAAVLAWDGQGTLELGPGRGALQAVPPGTPGSLPLALAPQAVLTVRFRTGGETFRPAGGAGSRPLKKVLQDGGVPPWLRARLPLLHADGEPAAAGDRFAAAAAAPGPERPPTLHLRWKKPQP